MRRGTEKHEGLCRRVCPGEYYPASGYAPFRVLPGVRLANGILDELEANAAAFSLGNTRAVLISMDITSLFQVYAEPLRWEIAEAAGLEPEAVILHCTNTHTGPEGEPGPQTRPADSGGILHLLSLSPAGRSRAGPAGLEARPHGLWAARRILPSSAGSA